MEYVGDVNQDGEVKITLSQFKEFLLDVGRSNRCPVCPHVGAWNFYVDKHDQPSDNALLAVTPVTSEYHSKPDDTYYVLPMECPNCGHMEFTSAHTVLQWLERQEDDK